MPQLDESNNPIELDAENAIDEDMSQTNEENSHKIYNLQIAEGDGFIEEFATKPSEKMNKAKKENEKRPKKVTPLKAMD